MLNIFVKLNSNSCRFLAYSKIQYSTGDVGSGAGKGGGTGGSIREAGGKFGEIEAAQENVYFKKVEKQQLETLRKHFEKEIKHDEKEIERQKGNIQFHREHIDRIVGIITEEAKTANKKSV